MRDKESESLWIQHHKHHKHQLELYHYTRIPTYTSTYSTAKSIPFRYTKRESITMLIVLVGDRRDGSGVNFVGSTALLQPHTHTDRHRQQPTTQT
jgi:hypothetical protein